MKYGNYTFHLSHGVFDGNSTKNEWNSLSEFNANETKNIFLLNQDNPFSGFKWYDVRNFNNDSYQSGRYALGKETISNYLKEVKIDFIIRGHQDRSRILIVPKGKKKEFSFGNMTPYTGKKYKLYTH